MNKVATLIHEISPEQINSAFSDLQNQIADLKKNFEPKTPVEYLTRADVAKLLSINLSTLHNWCVSGKLKPLGIGSRVYFRRSDIDALMIPITN